MIGTFASPLGRWTVAAMAFAVAPAIIPAAQAQEKVLRAVLHADVRTLDPFWTTQTIAGIHGMLVYDTLFGNDEDVHAEAADGRHATTSAPTARPTHSRCATA